MTTIEELDVIHKNLRKYRYFYYECKDILLVDISIISDYEYDILEKKYEKLCDELQVVKEKRITNFIGFDIGIPMSLLSNLEV